MIHCGHNGHRARILSGAVAVVSAISAKRCEVDEIRTTGGSHMLKKMIAILLAVAILPAGALACTEIYVGSGMTEDGSTVIARLEEYETNRGWPKTFDIIPEGSHKAGEEYLGCYGFRWTFTHDSYSYTAFSDNTFQNVCADCEETHAHTPYQSAGTNSRGVTVTATETGENLAESAGASGGVSPIGKFAGSALRREPRHISSRYAPARGFHPSSPSSTASGVSASASASVSRFWEGCRVD